MKKNNNHGFTLAELLIVVAIIAVLVAIAIPVFTTQLERSRETTDAANIRAAYGDVMSKALSDSSNGYKTEVGLTQQKNDWQTEFEIAGVKTSEFTETEAKQVGGHVTIEYTPGTSSDDAKIEIGGCAVPETPWTVTQTGGEGGEGGDTP